MKCQTKSFRGCMTGLSRSALIEKRARSKCAIARALEVRHPLLTFKSILNVSHAGGRKLIAKEDIKAHLTSQESGDRANFRNLQTGDLLVSIPRKALLNRSTLAPYYSQAILNTLSTIRLICLHLCKYCILAREDSLKAAEHPFAEYIESLPESFDSVPLQHAFDDSSTSWANWQTAGLIPSGLKVKADDVYKRCNDDYEAVCATAPDKSEQASRLCGAVTKNTPQRYQRTTSYGRGCAVRYCSS